MKIIMYRKLCAICSVVLLVTLFFIVRPIAHAATISLIPSATSAKIGDQVTLLVQLDTEDTYINAAQATIHYTNSVLQGVSTSHQDSSFNFWVQEPTIADSDGAMSFIGGTAKGVSGKTLSIVKMTFKVKGTGTAQFEVTDAVVTANDGKGTNVLSMATGASIAVGGGTSSQASPPSPKPQQQAPVVVAPAPVVRQASLSNTAPQTPQIRVPFYPDQLRWYNQKGNIVAFWDIPDDVVQVATRLSQSKDKISGTIDDQLYNGKEFGTLPGDGVWYIRVQFKNNVGWSPLAYYSISLDTVSPLPFEVREEGAGSDNPSPQLFFETNDSLSGIDKYEILVDGQKVLETASTSVTMPPQPPGSHELAVRAFDKAGNSTEDTESFEILPIATPTIDFVTTSVSAGEPVFLSGTALSTVFVELRILNKKGAVAMIKNSNSDSEGNWTIQFKGDFPIGSYSVFAIAHDERGALSFLSDPQYFSVKPPIIISFGFVQLGWFEIFVILFLIVLAGGSFTAWYYVSKKNMESAYGTIAVRDVKKFGDILESHLKELEINIMNDKNRTKEQAKGEVKHNLSQLHETVAKMKKYLVDVIKKS